MTGRSRQPPCTKCAQRPVAMRGVAFCFGCWPGGPVQPPPCLRCGSRRDYFTSGVCVRCHRSGRPGVDSCRDCQAWGATRMLDWLCRGCSSWRRGNPTVGACLGCGRRLHLGKRGACRLCHRQAALARGPRGELDIVGANAPGQQLFLADLFQRHHDTPRPGVDGDQAPAASTDNLEAPPPANSSRSRHEQLLLLDAPRNLATHGRSGLYLRADPARAAALEGATRDVARQRGWSTGQTEDACFGIRVVLGIQDTTTGPIKASDVALLRDIDLPVWSVLEVLAAAGLLLEDRTPTLDGWVAAQISALPEPMNGELQTWFEVMKHGAPTPPRRRARTETTIRLHLRWALPVIRGWAGAGHTSLREITREHVLDALPASGNARSTTGQGLKSVFRLLKARKVLFTDPTARVKTGQHQTREPLPVDLDALRSALQSPNPARALVVALTAFHGLRVGHLQRLLLTDIRDGRLHADGRVIVLADPVRDRMAGYLDHRNSRWPNTTNPHLFVHYRTAGGTGAVGGRFIRLAVGPGLTPSGIREDRILNEAHATAGDVRQLTALFGLSVGASIRYAASVDHPDLTRTRPLETTGADRRDRTDH